MALLPKRARDAILSMCASQLTASDVHDQFLEFCEQLRAVNGGDNADGLVQLTDREATLLPLLATSDTVPAIAKKLQVSVHTLRNQVATLRDKFQAATRADLVRKAGDYGALR